MKYLTGKDAYVGLLVALSSVEWIIFTIMSSLLLKHYKKIELTTISVAGIALSFALLPFVKRVWSFVIVETFKTFFAAASTVTLGLFIRDIASKRNLGKIEGFYFTLMNIAYLIGPLFGGLIAKAYHFSMTFVLAAIISTITLIILLVGKPKEKTYIEEKHEKIITDIKDYFANKNMAIVFLVSVGLAMWWAILYTYVPLFVTERGFDEAVVGYALALFVVPLLVLEIPAGMLADRFGYRRFLLFGFVLMSVVLFVTAFVSNIYIFIALITFACIGSAFVEPLREAYFFRIAPRKDETRFYTIYRVAMDIGYFVAPLLFSSVLLVTNNSYKMLYFVGALLLLFFGLFAVFLTKVRKKGYAETIVGHEEKESSY